MKFVTVGLLAAFSIQSSAKDLKGLNCKCEDKSTSTHYEYTVHFSSPKSANVSLLMSRESQQRHSLCRQREGDFTITKVDNSGIQMNGIMECDGQKPQKLELNFDSSSMTLPHDSCHKDTVFSCEWET
jgi:hypothetical protein